MGAGGGEGGGATTWFYSLGYWGTGGMRSLVWGGH